MIISPTGRLPIWRLTALTALALLLHGYHLGVEDGEIYIPAAKKLLRPSLYSFAAEFFQSHAHLSLFASVLAGASRLTHLPIDWTIFAWYLVTLFTMLTACWLVASACFTSARARWCSILVMTAVLAMPATNTGLLLVDPYLTARSFSTPLTLLSIAGMLERKYVLAAAAALLTALVHPQMAVYLVALAFVLWIAERAGARVKQPVPVLASAIGILPAGFHLAPAAGPYREALYSRDYFFLYNWSWYHWLGMLAPLAILACFWKFKLRGTSPAFSRLSFSVLPFGLISIAIAIFLAISPSLDTFARLQPLRTFHLITIVLIILLGGVAGEYLAKGRPWVVAAIATPLAVGMFFVARTTYPNSPQIEFPFASNTNAWVSSLNWIRANTPENAVFAVDSRYFKEQDTDVHGFRAISERSALADYFKDGGVVSLFPNLAEDWKQMSDATYGLNHFKRDDFRRLRAQYPQVSWTVIHGQAPSGMDCPHQQQGYSVCRMP